MSIRGLPGKFDDERDCNLFLFGFKALLEKKGIKCGDITERNYMRDGKRYPVLELQINLTARITIGVRYEERQIQGSGSNKFWVLSDYWSGCDFSWLAYYLGKDND